MICPGNDLSGQRRLIGQTAGQMKCIATIEISPFIGSTLRRVDFMPNIKSKHNMQKQAQERLEKILWFLLRDMEWICLVATICLNEYNGYV